MILGIDATNIRTGGGLTHLKEVLSNATPKQFGFEIVVIWSSQATLDKLPNFDWLDKQSHPYLNKGFLASFFFQIVMLPKMAKQKKCSVVFVPGGTFLGNFRPFVTMSQNMLPFEFKEASRFKSFSVRLRFLILFFLQSFTFKRANGIVFLTNYAFNFISKKIKLNNKKNIIIPHGISKEFLNHPKNQIDIENYSKENPFKILYVSIVTAYKHQWNVAEAVLKLHQEGFPIQLNLIGPYTNESISKLSVFLQKKENVKVINYLGSIPHKELSNFYKEADTFVFASTCENMPIILIEAMTAGLPIACSEKQPMPEVLEDAGIYFDATNSESIYNGIKQLLLDSNQRQIIATKAFEKTKNYTWKNCSNHTFQYLQNIAIQYNHYVKK
ncbi:glycosyltransferase family 4 protein [Flavobacterium channae]|uniref:glycosyltransferase family 4 protein n=1 Tax=Flavobacterium channae TaxID=2897181 RepID=UPI001E553705|nr:glycosyltransferase family 1 protein [Flavobacterium channae]UGS24174.1 glycosyltransferase family 4 protein [Flavobacterium channae]